MAVEFVGPSPAVEEALDHLRATYGAEWIDPEDRRAGFEVRGDEPPLRVLGRASGVAPAGVVLVLAPGPDQDWSLVGEACEELERSLIKAGRLHTTPTRALSGPMPVSDEGFVTEPTGLPPAFLQLLHAARFCDDLAPAGEVLREIRSEVLGNR